MAHPEKSQLPDRWPHRALVLWVGESGCWPDPTGAHGDLEHAFIFSWMLGLPEPSSANRLSITSINFLVTLLLLTCCPSLSTHRVIHGFMYDLI